MSDDRPRAIRLARIVAALKGGWKHPPLLAGIGLLVTAAIALAQVPAIQPILPGSTKK